MQQSVDLEQNNCLLVTQAAFALAPAPAAISISFAVCPNAGATPKIATRAKRPNSTPNGFDFMFCVISCYYKNLSDNSLIMSSVFALTLEN